MKNILTIFRKTRTITALSVCCLLSYSCNDVLESSPKGSLTDNQLTTPQAVETLVTSAYGALRQHFAGNGEAFQGPASNWVHDVRSDDAYKGGGGTGDLGSVFELEMGITQPQNGVAYFKWRNNILAISRVNFAIQQIDKVIEDDYPKVIRTAEMRFLRGHFHFDLKRNFNKIPYFDGSGDVSKVSNKQYSSEELWKKIEEDFLYAFDNLPTSVTEVGRANKYTAAAYLAKLYIETKQWSKALEKANFVIQSGKYSLETEFENLATVEHENGPESVFAIQYSTENNFAGHDWGNLLNVTKSVPIAQGGYANGDNFYLASQNLVNAFRVDQNGLPLFDTFDQVDAVDVTYEGPLDPRVDFTVGRVGIPWKGTALYSNDWKRDADVYTTNYSGKKHLVAPNAAGIHTGFPWAASGLNFMIIRYAEVLLWKAEALIESNQDLEEARKLINDVRLRAKNSTYVRKLDGSGDAANYLINPYPANLWSQDYARKALRFERRLELAMEGHRMFDLIRWGNAAEIMNAYFESESEDAPWLETAQFTPGQDEYLPIPQGEIDLNPEVYEQNEAYK